MAPTLRPRPRALTAFLAGLVALAACRASSPSSPGTPPPPASADLPAVVSSPAALAEPPAADSASPASSLASTELRRFTAGFLADDATQQYPNRAYLKQLASVRLHLGEEPSPFTGGSGTYSSSSSLVVIEQREKELRIVVETNDLRLLVWAQRGAFERVPTKATRLALKPGIYPDGPPDMPGHEMVGVWLGPGWQQPVTRQVDGWREVKLSDTTVEAQGWLDESLLGEVFPPASGPEVQTHSRVFTGTTLLATPRGPSVGRVLPNLGAPPSLNPWFQELGAAPRGFHHIVYAHTGWWVDALVPEAAFRPPSYGSGYGRGYGSVRHFLNGPKPTPVLKIEPGADLFDQPRGEVVARSLRDVLIPDRIEHRSEAGRRQVEVLVGELGLLRLWVDESRIHPYEPPPPASASASGSAAPRPPGKPR